MLQFLKHYSITLVLIFIVDYLWIHFVAGRFYAKQLESIGRFTADGGFDVRLAPGVMVYLLMALALEVFIFQNPNLKTFWSVTLHGALLGFVVYGVYDGTNRAILADYPLPMFFVDMLWGTTLFTILAAANFVLRHRLNF